MLRKIAIGLFATVAVTGIAALAQTFAPNMPILGGPAYCSSTNNGVCVNTVPAGPSLTGNETIPADTNATPVGGIQAGKIPVPVLYSNFNGLIGGDFSQNLWQRGTSFSSLALNTAILTADAWYVYAPALPLVSVSKQTAQADQPPGSGASYRLQRVASQTSLGQFCTGQLLPDDSSDPFIVGADGVTRTTIFSAEIAAGANFSPTGVNMIIAYHSAADVTTPGANGQGTNTGTFASSTGTTQNITNYTEAVNTLITPTTSFARYSVSAVIPNLIPGTATATAGVGVKLCLTGVGTAGTNDWIEFGNAQLEYRGGTSTAPSPFKRRLLADEWNLQYARYWTIFEAGAGSPIHCPGQGTTTNGLNFTCQFPVVMRITPVTSPITIGGFKSNSAGTLQTIAVLNTTGLGNTPRTGNLSGTGTITAGQGTTLVSSGAGTGIIGWSAEP